MASVQLYRERRREIMKIIDGDAFFPLKSWPKVMKLIFLEETNERRRNLQARALPGRKWLLARFDPALDRAGPVQLYWATPWQRAEKRARQVDYVLNNVDQKRNS